MILAILLSDTALQKHAASMPRRCRGGPQGRSQLQGLFQMPPLCTNGLRAQTRQQKAISPASSGSRANSIRPEHRQGVVHFPIAGVVHFPPAANTDLDRWRRVDHGDYVHALAEDGAGDVATTERLIGTISERGTAILRDLESNRGQPSFDPQFHLTLFVERLYPNSCQSFGTKC